MKTGRPERGGPIPERPQPVPLNGGQAGSCIEECNDRILLVYTLKTPFVKLFQVADTTTEPFPSTSKFIINFQEVLTPFT